MSESGTGIKVICVCPLAHRFGHYPRAITEEASALLDSGVEVAICTFRGIRDQEGLRTIPHRTVVSGRIGFPLGVITNMVKFMPKEKFLAGFLEQFSTLCLAVRVRKKLGYDAIYLRDGDPYIFIPFLIGFFLKDSKWVINLIGERMARAPNSMLSSLFYSFINAPIWKPIYHRALSRNQFTFICQSKYVKDFFEVNLLNGILAGRVTFVPLGVQGTAEYVPREEARRHLGLPEGKAIFLHFGALHRGKDIETILAAIKEIPDVILVHAGVVTPWANMAHLVESYGLQGRVIINNSYIPEAEKRYYFAAADAVILSYKKSFLQEASMFRESAKFRLPSITSDVGGLGRLAREYKTGPVFEAENAASLRGAIYSFINSSQEGRETMANNCQKFCNDFSLDTWARKCKEIIEEL